MNRILNILLIIMVRNSDIKLKFIIIIIIFDHGSERGDLKCFYYPDFPRNC